VEEIAVTAVGADRPGIVAALTEALLDLGGNLRDVRAALLRGSFAVSMLVAVPRSSGADAVEAALRPVAERLGLGLWVGPAAPPAAGDDAERCIVSVYGSDHPGIVHAITVALAGAGANIVDLSARSAGDPPLYVLAIEAELAPGATAASVEALLRPVADRSGVELAVTPVGDEVL
jgi:glycine cleavage system transcriptional repressor